MTEQVFVARERELSQLHTFLDSVLAGRGQVCFVTGEAGAGKTALITEFARRAQGRHDDLIVAIGDCNAQTGIGDPYLPFREILAQLTGDVEAGVVTVENAGRLQSFLRESGRVLVELGPDLIDVFVPGAGVATRAATLLAGKLGWAEQLQQLTQRKATGEAGLEQQHIFEQYARVLKAMSAHQPLVLIIDDLQWADADSVGLLFHLGRRIGDGRILILGAYRPDELALGRGAERHPLEKVLAEFKRYFGDVWVHLGEASEVEGLNFVDRLIDTEPNDLGEEFRRALYHHTNGHPLFTVELLRDMQERGDPSTGSGQALVHDEEGRWVAGPQLDWKRLPARVEGVIEERIGRLDQELHDILMVASVEGEDFTAEVVARVGAAEERNLVRRLSRELDRQHRLVSARGFRRVGRQRLSLYRFQHNLFQQYLYTSLDEIERSFLHEDVGNVLEELYGDQVEEITVQLARHFEEAGVEDKARHYLQQAGERARRQYANTEAVKYLSRALEMAPEADYAERYDLLVAREQAYHVQGAREEQFQDLTTLQELAEILDDDRRRVAVSLRRAGYALVTDDYPATIAAARTAIDIAQAAQNVRGMVQGHLYWGRALVHQGEYELAQSHLEQALTLVQAAPQRPYPVEGLRRLEADSLRVLGIVSYHLGDYSSSRSWFQQALRLYRETDDRRGESASLNNLSNVVADQGDYVEARDYLEQALRTYREIGDREGEGLVLGNLGSIAREQGDFAGAQMYHEQALHIHREVSSQQFAGNALVGLGNTAYQVGHHGEAGLCYQQALRIYRTIGDRAAEGYVLAQLGVLSHDSGDDESAREYGRQALHIAEQLGNHRDQAHALLSLGDALIALGRPDEGADALQQALTIRRRLGQSNLAMEPLAGLARAHMLQGDLIQAQARVEQILSHLESRTLEGIIRPFRVYLTCYRVLEAGGDPRARAILSEAYNLLQEEASRIDDEEMRHSFLENVPAHREVIQEWREVHDG